MAKATPERKIISEEGGLHMVLVRQDAWDALSEQAERIGVSSQEFLSMCMIFGIKDPWAVVEGVQGDG